MKNLMKMETKVFNSLKRDLITWDEAQYCLYGYIHCMVDMGCITEDRGNRRNEQNNNKIIGTQISVPFLFNLLLTEQNKCYIIKI
jgi:hypothetical protein